MTRLVTERRAATPTQQPGLSPEDGALAPHGPGLVPGCPSAPTHRGDHQRPCFRRQVLRQGPLADHPGLEGRDLEGSPQEAPVTPSPTELGGVTDLGNHLRPGFPRAACVARAVAPAKAQLTHPGPAPQCRLTPLPAPAPEAAQTCSTIRPHPTHKALGAGGEAQNSQASSQPGPRSRAQTGAGPGLGTQPGGWPAGDPPEALGDGQGLGKPGDLAPLAPPAGRGSPPVARALDVAGKTPDWGSRVRTPSAAFGGSSWVRNLTHSPQQTAPGRG